MRAKARKTLFLIAVLASLPICYCIWPVVSHLTADKIQPIASAVSTISGVLFGFVMASITLFASAKDNTLVRNTTLTGYFPKLVNRLHLTMGALLFVCFIFLVLLFIPDALVFSVYGKDFKVVSVVLLGGIFFLILSFILFFQAWLDFKSFAQHM